MTPVQEKKPYIETLPQRNSADDAVDALFVGDYRGQEAVRINDGSYDAETEAMLWGMFGDSHGCEIDGRKYLLHSDAVRYWRILWEQLERIGKKNVLAIVGPAGSGKTTYLKNQLSALGFPPDKVFPCAPTGVACERLRHELKQVNELLGNRVDTPHTRYQLSDEYGQFNGAPEWLARWLPKKSAEPNIYILDEAPNADLRTVALMLLKVRTGSKLVICGDVNQLPPVGWGEPIRTVLDSGWLLPDTYVKLTTIHRSGSNTSMLDASNKILKGEMPESGPGFNVRTVNGFSEMSEQVLNLMRNGYQVLTPTNGLAVWFGLQHAKWRFENEPGRKNGGRKVDTSLFMNRGDRVRIISKAANRSQGIFNGMEGEYWGYSPSRGYHEVIPSGGRKAGTKYKVRITPEIKARIDSIVAEIMLKSSEDTAEMEKLCVDTQRDACNGALMHAESITVHRAQGSEWDRVVFVIPENCRMLNRELFYVGATRAKHDTVIIFMKDDKPGVVSHDAKKDVLRPSPRKPYKIFTKI